MAGFHGVKTVTTAGTSVPLVASSAGVLEKWCAQVSIFYVGANNIYVGIGTAETDVSSTDKGWTLTADDPSVTIGDLASGQNAVNLSHIWIDTDTNGQGVTFVAEQF